MTVRDLKARLNNIEGQLRIQFEDYSLSKVVCLLRESGDTLWLELSDGLSFGWESCRLRESLEEFPDDMGVGLVLWEEKITNLEITDDVFMDINVIGINRIPMTVGDLIERLKHLDKTKDICYDHDILVGVEETASEIRLEMRGEE